MSRKSKMREGERDEESESESVRDEAGQEADVLSCG